jgi:RNase P subunit RPR2
MGATREYIVIKCTKCGWQSRFDKNKIECPRCGASTRLVFEKEK